MIQVSMGIIFDEKGRVLIAKRAKEKSFGGLWEFPGGKIEEGETAALALIRELQEELAITVTPIQEYESYIFEGENVTIEFFPIQCRIVSGKLFKHEHEEITYIDVGLFEDVEFAPPDFHVVDLIKNEYSRMVEFR